jgi:uncharacterized membrane protein
VGLISDQSRERLPRLSTGDQVPLHPALTDIPVATLSLAPVFDAIALVTGSRSAGAAGLWTGATAVLWALPTAATGALDYLRAPSGSPIKRIGIAHAALNTFALTMMASSLVSRRFRSAPTPLSLLFSAAAGATVTYSSHLGGVMVYREGMGVSGEGLEATSSLGAQTSDSPMTSIAPVPTLEATSGRVATPAGRPLRATGGPAALSPLGAGGGEASTIGGVAEDSPDTHDAGLVAGTTDDPLSRTSGREQRDELDRFETAVEESRESPDDIAADEGGPAGGGPPDEQHGGEGRAA